MDSISGGSIPTDGVVKLTIDNDKVGYIVFPDGSVGTTIAGVWDTVWGGNAGSITYFVPKNTNSININSSGITGDIIYSGFADLDCIGCVNLTTVTAVNTALITCGVSTGLISINTPLAKTVNFVGCVDVNNLDFPIATSIVSIGSVTLADILAPKAVVFLSSACALTAKSIGDILYAAYVDNRANVNFDFSGGTNAQFTAIETYFNTTYNVTLETAYLELIDNGGKIKLNGVTAQFMANVLWHVDKEVNESKTYVIDFSGPTSARMYDIIHPSVIEPWISFLDNDQIAAWPSYVTTDIPNLTLIANP